MAVNDVKRQIVGGTKSFGRLHWRILQLFISFVAILFPIPCIPRGGGEREGERERERERENINVSCTLSSWD